jgi:hypothetical protein
MTINISAMIKTRPITFIIKEIKDKHLFSQDRTILSNKTNDNFKSKNFRILHKINKIPLYQEVSQSSDLLNPKTKNQSLTKDNNKNLNSKKDKVRTHFGATIETDHEKEIPTTK